MEVKNVKGDPGIRKKLFRAPRELSLRLFCNVTLGGGGGGMLS